MFKSHILFCHLFILYFISRPHCSHSCIYLVSPFACHHQTSWVSPLPWFLTPGWLCSVTGRATLRLPFSSINGVSALICLPAGPLCVHSPPSVCHTAHPQSGLLLSCRSISAFSLLWSSVSACVCICSSIRSQLPWHTAENLQCPLCLSVNWRIIEKGFLILWSWSCP